MVQRSSSPRHVKGCDWESTDGKFLLWDDGHVPVNLLRQGDLQQTLLVQDPNYHQQQQHEVHVIDDSVHESLVDAIYKYTVQQSAPWGSYVRIDQIEDEWNRDGALHTPSLFSAVKEMPSQEEILVKLAAAYLHHVLQLLQDSSGTPDIMKDAHGIAIWGLAANEGSQVTYHLDYAEQLRYQFNIIVPPIYAGTLQCSNIAAMKGGCYCVHTAGLKHYEKYGFKGKKSSLQNSQDMLNEDFSEGQWLNIPYRCNRMIVQRGHLPHLSTPIESLPLNLSRVIVGFNVFRHDVGPFVEGAPEHSSAFRRRVALQGILERNLGGKSLSLESVRCSPALAKLLVQAKRMKIKNELLHQQKELDERIDSLLKHQAPRNVGELIECLSKRNGEGPNADDVHVHIHRRCKEGRWVLLLQGENESFKQLISTMASVTLSEPK